MKKLWVALWGLSVFGLAACSSSAYDPYYYDYAYYDPYYYGYDAYWTYTWVDPYGVYYFEQTPPAGDQGRNQVDVNAAAAAIAQRAQSFYTPSGCVTAVAVGATVSYTFNQCAGGLGIQSMSGDATVTVSDVGGGQLGLHGTSSNLTINGKAYVLDVTATATKAGDQRSVTFTSASHSPDLFNSRQAQGTLSWTQGSGCIDASGSGSSTRGNLSTTSTVTGYHRCDGTCPTAGTVTVQSPNGVFTSTFDGSGNLVVTAPNGDKKTFSLNCSK